MSEELGSYREGVERLTGLADVDEVLKGLTRLLKKTVQSLWTVTYLLGDQQTFTPAQSCGLPARSISLFREMTLSPDKAPLMRTLLRKKQYHVIADAGTSTLLPQKLRMMLKGVALLAVPMVVRNRVMGVVFVARGGDHPPFSPDEIAVIEMQVSHAALVVSHITLFDESLEMAVEMARRIDVIFMLDDINKAISSSLSHDKIIDTAMEHLQRISQCDFIAVLVQIKEQLTVRAVHATGIAVPESLQPGGVLAGPSLAGASFDRGASRYIPSLTREKHPGKVDTMLREAGLESLLAIPLISRETAKGVLLLGHAQPERLGLEDAFAIEKVAAQMAVALENSRLYEEMRELFISTIASLANAIDAKSPWTKGHSERVMRVAVAIARAMGMDEAGVERVRLGGLLHDIGKIGIIEALLEKPATLSIDEFPPMRLHPEKGVAILAPIAQLRDVLPGILHHHERFDGTGYPHGLKGEAIPLEARIISVADSYDAIISIRPYKKGLSAAHALAELRRCAGSQFDPAVVESLAGSVVRIESETERKQL